MTKKHSPILPCCSVVILSKVIKSVPNKLYIKKKNQLTLQNGPDGVGGGGEGSGKIGVHFMIPSQILKEILQSGNINKAKLNRNIVQLTERIIHNLLPGIIFLL